MLTRKLPCEVSLFYPWSREIILCLCFSYLINFILDFYIELLSLFFSCLEIKISSIHFLFSHPLNLNVGISESLKAFIFYIAKCFMQTTLQVIQYSACQQRFVDLFNTNLVTSTDTNHLFLVVYAKNLIILVCPPFIPSA